MLEHYIGPFQFVVLKGNPLLPTEQVELIQRPGVPGVGMLRTGVRGTPFTLLSKVDAPSVDDAHYLIRQYESIVGGDPVQLVKDSIWYGPLCFVLAVRSVDVRAIVGGVGGLNEESYAWAEAEWDLVAIGG